MVKVNLNDYGDTFKKENKDIIYDHCVLCGKKTDVPEDTPIMNREHYIEGAGQLCKKCYNETQN